MKPHLSLDTTPYPCFQPAERNKLAVIHPGSEGFLVHETLSGDLVMRWHIYTPPPPPHHHLPTHTSTYFNTILLYCSISLLRSSRDFVADWDLPGSCWPGRPPAGPSNEDFCAPGLTTGVAAEALSGPGAAEGPPTGPSRKDFAGRALGLAAGVGAEPGALEVVAGRAIGLAAAVGAGLLAGPGALGAVSGRTALGRMHTRFACALCQSQCAVGLGCKTRNRGASRPALRACSLRDSGSSSSAGAAVFLALAAFPSSAAVGVGTIFSALFGWSAPLALRINLACRRAICCRMAVV
jgi:hypothetical protein